MFKILFNHWLYSLSLFIPRRFKAFVCYAFKRYVQALKTTYLRLGWLCLVDFILIAVFGSYLFKAFSVTKTPTTEPHFIMFVALLIEINWFIFKTALFLFIRKKDSFDAMTYFRQYFFAYLQLLLIIYFFVFIGFTMILSLGISKIPHVPWLLIFVGDVLKTVLAFYWLDSPMQFSDLVYSLERATNFLVYNLPLILLSIPLIWGLDIGVKTLFFGCDKAYTTDLLFLNNKLDQLIKLYLPATNIFLFFCMRYLIFFIEFFWVSLLFVVYEQKKSIQYSSSYFEQP